MWLIIFALYISVLFCLHLLCKSVEYKETIKKLNKDNISLRESNKRLAVVIQEEQDKIIAFDAECG